MAGETTDSGAEAEPQGEAPTAFEDAFAAFAKGETPAEAAAPEPEAKSEATPEPVPAPEAGKDENEAAPAPPAQPASDEFDLDSLPPAAKAAFEKLQHAERSARGRIAALSRQVSQPSSAPQPAAKPDANAEEKSDPFDTDEIKALEADYPEIAGPLLKIIRDQNAELGQVRGTAKAVEQDRTQQFLDGQVVALEAAMPDWKKWGSDSRFDEWILTQPRHVQEAAQRNNQVIVDAAEAQDVLERFKSAFDAPPAPAPAPDPRRERQLNAGKDATTQAPVAGNGPPDDFQGAFAHFAGKQAAGGNR